MSEASKRENLLPIIEKQQEIIEDLTRLNKVTINLLSQFISVEEYEYKLRQIRNGNDVII